MYSLQNVIGAFFLMTSISLSSQTNFTSSGQFSFLALKEQSLLPTEQTSPSPKVLSTEFKSVDLEVISREEVLVSWRTAIEVNSDYFIVQRSSDGEHWEEIIKKPAKRNSLKISNYLVLDEAPLAGKSFYRIQQYDQDGSSTESKTQLINIHESDFQIYHELEEQKVFLYVSNSSPNLRYSIKNALGLEQITDYVHENETEIDISSLGAGTYLIELSSSPIARKPLVFIKKSKIVQGDLTTHFAHL